MLAPRALLDSEVFGVKLKFYRNGPVDDAVGDGGGGDRMADDQDVDKVTTTTRTSWQRMNPS